MDLIRAYACGLLPDFKIYGYSSEPVLTDGEDFVAIYREFTSQCPKLVAADNIFRNMYMYTGSARELCKLLLWYCESYKNRQGRK